MTTVPAVRTFVDAPDPNSFLTYADWNAALFDTLSLILNPPMVHLQQQVAQSIANNTLTAITFDTEVIDTEGVHSTSTNPSRVTPKTPGWYMGWFGCSWATTSTGRRLVMMRKNGTGTGSAGTFGRVDWRPTSAGNAQKGFRFFQYFNGTTDYVELMVYQSSGAALSTFTGAPEVYPELFMRWWKTL